MATALDQTIERGTTASLTFTVTQGGTAFDLSAATDIRWLAKLNVDDDDDAAIITKTLAASQLVVSGGSHNIVTLTINPADTKVGAPLFGTHNGSPQLYQSLRAYFAGGVVQGLLHDPTTGQPIAPLLTCVRVAGEAVA